MSTIDDDLVAVFGMTEAEADAIMARAKAGQLTDEDQAKITTAIEAFNEVLPQLMDAFNGVAFPFTWLFDDVPAMVAACNQFLAESGIDARLTHKPTFRTEPIAGAELGGQPRNPEADVIDEIDRLVNWQIEKGGGW